MVEWRSPTILMHLDRFDQPKFEHEPKPGHNYDRARLEGEGRDWD